MKRVLFFAIYCLGAGISFGQAPLPQAAVNTKTVSNTNGFNQGGYSGSWQPNTNAVSCDADSGIVGYAMDATGTNPVLMSASEPTFKNGVVESDDVRLHWYAVAPVVWTSDFVTWHTDEVVGAFSETKPKTEAMFFYWP